MDRPISIIKLAFSGVTAIALAASVGAADTIRVPSDQPTIQDAINFALDGDMILVSPGTYVENIDFLGKSITLVSEVGPDATIIDAGDEAPTVTFQTNESREAVLEGFTITGGFNIDGGGILITNASPTIRGNVITNNRACFNGGGINVRFGSPRIEGNTISLNLVQSSPCGSGTEAGGGIALGGAGAPEIVGNTIENNTADDEGGAISMFAAGDPTIEGNVMRRNMAKHGAAISMVNRSDADIINNLIVDNTASMEGGGVHWLVPSGDRGPLLVNNTIANNDSPQGSAIFADGFDVSTELTNNVIVGRQGQTAVFCGDFNDLNPPIFSFNNIFGPEGIAYGGICTAQTDINGNISEDPLFVDPMNGDFHLQPASPSIDTGNNAAPELPATDIDGDLRVLDGNGDGDAIVDMGADEFVIQSITVDVDIKPGSDTNTLNPRSKGVIPVAILATHTFDSADVDPTTVMFGPNQTTKAHSSAHLVDVNGDGAWDLLLHFRTQETG